MILFLDPHVSHLRKMGASTQKPGIKLRFLKVSIIDRFRDQFMPYNKLLGCDLDFCTQLAACTAFTFQFHLIII